MPVAVQHAADGLLAHDGEQLALGARDDATLARFRRRHQDAIAELFAQVLALCVKAGLVDAGVVAIDGTKIGADASFFANRKREALAKEILAEAEARIAVGRR